MLTECIICQVDQQENQSTFGAPCLNTTEDISNTESAQTQEDDIDMITLGEWRQQLYSSYGDHDRSNIYVQRDDLAVSVLGVYKRSTFNIYKQPQVVFAGEAGKFRIIYKTSFKNVIFCRH